MCFRDLGCFNQAILAKQGWKLIRNPGSLVGRVLKSCNFPNCTFLNVKKEKHASFVWRSIIWGRKVIKKGSRWRVGFGMNIDIYKDMWLPKPSTFKIYDPPPILGKFKVAMLHLENGNWNIALIEHLFYVDDATYIISLHVGSFDHTDVLIWHYTKDGEYMVKSGYKWFQSVMVLQNLPNWVLCNNGGNYFEV